MGLHIIPYKALARCSLEELAAEQRRRDSSSRRLSSGVSFARKDAADNSPGKDAARDLVLGLLQDVAKGQHVSALTMPGHSWFFEGRLLKAMQPEWRLIPMVNAFTLTCVENDRYVYYSAATKMPGNKHSLVRTLERPAYAEHCIGNGMVGRYLFANVDDLMSESAEVFDFVWLDYTGPLSLDRMATISAFWRRSVQSAMVITSLRARWNRRTADAISRHGDLSSWMRSRMSGAVHHDIEYQDGPSPMSQIAFVKEAA